MNFQFHIMIMSFRKCLLNILFYLHLAGGFPLISWITRY